MAIDAQNQPKKDVPWQVALAGFLALVVLFYYAQSPKTFTAFFDQLDHYGDTHLGFVGAIVIALTVNCIWIYSLCAESLGINQQGKRLEILTGKKKKVSPPPKVAGVLMVGGAFYVLSFLVLSQGWFDLLPTFLPQTWYKPVTICLSVNFGLCGGIGSSFMGRIETLRFFRRKNDGLLPAMPTPKNGIVLGTINEEVEDELS
jgi:hypothetical protein